MTGLLLIFISFFSTANTKLVLSRSSVIDIYGTWKSDCVKVHSGYTRTFTNIRPKKTVIYRIKYTDRSCEQPRKAIRIRAISQLKSVGREYEFNLKYRDISTSCLKNCIPGTENKWKTIKRTSRHFLFTRIAVDGNILFYADVSPKLNGASRKRRPTAIDSAKFDTRANYLPVFLTPIK